MSLESQQHIRAEVHNSAFSLAIGRIELTFQLRKSASARDKLMDDTASEYLPELEVILNKVSPVQVLHAKRKNALDGRKGKWVHKYQGLDYTFGTVMALPFLVFLVLLLPLHWQPLSNMDRLAWGGMVLSSVVAILILANEYWLPHIYARRSLAVLREHHDSKKADDV